MKRLQKLVTCLNAAIKEEGAEYLSTWSKRRYLDLFDDGPQGLGQIKSAEIAPLFSFPQDASPKEVEQALCTKFEEYSQSGFFKKLWWYFTKPVDLYKKVYALTHLRDLKADYLSIQAQATNPNDTHSSFLALLKPLTDYLTSYLPYFETMNQITQGQSMSTHAQMYATFIELKKYLTDEYNCYLYPLIFPQNTDHDPDRQNNLMMGIEFWKTKFKNHLETTILDNNLSSHHRKDYQGLMNQLDDMYLILSTINEYQRDPNVDVSSQFKQAELDVHTDPYNYLGLLQQIEHDCAVYIIDKNNPKPIESYTYTLTHDNKTDWVLSYCDKDLNKPAQIPLNQVNNLISLFLTNDPDLNAIKQCIFTHHASLVNPTKKPNPIQRNDNAINASPDKQIVELLCDYSLNVSVKKIKQGTIDPQEIIAELMNYSQMICKDKNPYIKAHLAMYERLQLQAIQYKNIIDLITARSVKFQTNALCYAFENQNITADEVHTHLTTVLWPQCHQSDLLSLPQEYNALGAVAKKQPEHYLNENNKFNLKWIKKITKIRAPESALHAFFRSSISPEHAQIKQQLEAITAQSLQLSETDCYNHLKEKSLEMMGRILCTEAYDTYTLRLAFSEIHYQFQSGMNHFRSELESQNSKLVHEPLIKEPTINQPAISPLPTIDTKLAWTLWLSEIMAEPNTLSVALNVLEIRVKELTNNWEIDFLRYNTLIKLALHWVEALKWDAVSTNVSIEEASEQVIAMLRNCNKLFAKRYHSDKNRGADEEIMKSFNSCRDAAILSIEKIGDEETCPEWIQSLIDKDPNLFITNWIAKRIQNLNQQIDINRTALSKIKEECTKGNKELAKGNKELAKGSKDLAKEIAQIREDLAKGSKAFTKEIEDRAKEIDQIRENLVKDRSQEREDHVKMMAKLEGFNEQLKNLQRLKTEKMQAQNSTAGPAGLGLFAENNRIFKPQIRYPATILSQEHQQILKENDWEITQPSEDKCNFFTALASEINRVKKKQGADELTEKSLRQFCYQFHRKNNRNKNIITNLNESFQKTNENAFQQDRKDHYEHIKFDVSTENEKSPTIEGQCCVEGVIILRFYKLSYIFEMSIDKNNQIHYALVTDDGYQACTKDEFNQKSKYSPILLNVEGNYYIASKQKPPTKEKEIVEDMLPMTENDSIRTPKSKKQVSQPINDNTDDTVEFNNFTI